MQPETSLEAYAAIKPSLRPLQEQVLNTIKRFPCGVTDEQLFNITGIAPNTCRPRRIELVALGLVMDTGDRQRTTSGRQAILWKAV